MASQTEKKKTHKIGGDPEFKENHQMDLEINCSEEEGMTYPQYERK